MTSAPARGVFVRPLLALLLAVCVLGASAGAAPAANPPLGQSEVFPISGMTGSAWPTWLAVGMGGAIWLTDDGGATVRRMDASGQVTNVIPSGTRTFGIATTADGKVWFANETVTGWGVGRADADAGSPTWFAVAGSPAVQDLALGPDGKIWFTEWTGGHIGRVDPDGTVTRFATGVPNGYGYSIALGDDGNMWFTYIDAGYYGRITPAGSVTLWQSSLTDLSGIAADGNGHVWITAERTHKIIKVSTATGNVVAEYPTPANGPRQIALGPDGYMWFAMFNGNAIGRISRDSPTGTTPETWTLGSNVQPFDIVWGADGAMWYTARNTSGGGHIARIGTGSTTPAPGTGGGSTPPGNGGGSTPGSGGGSPGSGDSSTQTPQEPGCATPPAGPVGVSINGGATYTNSADVTLDIVWPACTATVSVANDGGFRDVSTLPVAAQVPWKLSASGPERLPKTVYLRFGADSQNYTDDIILDQSAPQITSASATASGATIRAARRGPARTVRVSVRARDRGGSGPVTVEVRAGGSRVTGVYGKRLAISTSRSKVRVRVQDRAGNWSAFRTIRVR